MWLMTKYGFYSIVKKNDGYHVRAREMGDLVNLKTECPKLKYNRVYLYKGTDYQYRLIVDQDDYLEIMNVLINAVDYPNFKDEVHKHLSQKNKLKPYFEIWCILISYLNEWKKKQLDPISFNREYNNDFQEEV